MNEVIDEGDKSKQGTHKCPNCGRRITMEFPYVGDPPKCPACGAYYEPIKRKKLFFSYR